MSSNITVLIACLVVGLVLLLIIILIVMIVSIMCRRDRSSKPNPQQRAPKVDTIDLDDREMSYSRRLPDDYREIRMDNEYSRQLPDKLTSSADLGEHYINSGSVLH